MASVREEDPDEAPNDDRDQARYIMELQAANQDHQKE